MKGAAQSRLASFVLVANAILLCSPLPVVFQPEVQPGHQRRLTHRQSHLKKLAGEADRFALVIGVDQYQDDEISDLKGASNDAESLADALIRYAGFPSDQVIALTSAQSLERQPTRANILRRLSNLRQAVPEDGLLLVYFSGHGMERKTAHGQQAYLLPMDAQLGGDISLAEDSAISVQSMRDRIRDTGVEQVIVILDACRNDPLQSRSVKLRTTLMSDAFKKFDFSRNRGIKAFATLYAAQIGEVAYEDNDKRQGYFTSALVEGIQGKASASTGEVTLAGLVKYVENRVPRLTALRGLKQQPFSVVEGFKADELIISISSDFKAEATAADQKRELFQRKMAVAAGVSVAIMGQSTQRVGAHILERALNALGVVPEQVRSFCRRYEALESSLKGGDGQAQTTSLIRLSQSDFRAILRDHIKEHSGDQFPAYVDMGYDLGYLMIILKFWEQLKDHASLFTISEERLTSLQWNVQRIVIPAALAQRVRGLGASRLNDKHYREAVRQVLDAALGHFDS
jgi:caspase domain-containing protein